MCTQRKNYIYFGLGPKNLRVLNNLRSRQFWVNNFWHNKNFAANNFGEEKLLGKTIRTHFFCMDKWPSDIYNPFENVSHLTTPKILN